MRILLTFFILLALTPVATGDVPKSQRSEAAIARVEKTLKQDLEKQALTLGKPVFIQIIKATSELKMYVQSSSGHFVHFRSYPICRFSGGLGPKKKEGDQKAPEGFYKVKPTQMNPASSYHLSFNLGYPNAFDRQNGYTGSFLMVHGRCVSIGCYAMTDPAMDEIWTLMSAAFDRGQSHIDVHIFPYRMNWPVRSVPLSHPDYPFWKTLIPAWTAFEDTRIPPRIAVLEGGYTVLR